MTISSPGASHTRSSRGFTPRGVLVLLLPARPCPQQHPQPDGACPRPHPVLCHGSDYHLHAATTGPVPNVSAWAPPGHLTPRAPREEPTLHSACPRLSQRHRRPPDGPARHSTRPLLPPQLSCHQILTPPRLSGPSPATPPHRRRWLEKTHEHPRAPHPPGPPHLRTMPTHRSVPKTRLPPATRKVCRGTKEAAGPGEKQRHGHTAQPQPPGASEEPQPWAANGFAQRQATRHGARFLVEASSRSHPTPPPAEPARPRRRPDAPELGASDACGQPHTPTHFRVAFLVAFSLPPRGAEGGKPHSALGTPLMAAPLRTVWGVLGALHQESGRSARCWGVVSRLSPRLVLVPHTPRALLPGTHGLSSLPEHWPPPLPPSLSGPSLAFGSWMRQGHFF